VIRSQSCSLKKNREEEEEEEEEEEGMQANGDPNSKHPNPNLSQNKGQPNRRVTREGVHRRLCL
jgi:hypothetical protein